MKTSFQNSCLPIVKTVQCLSVCSNTKRYRTEFHGECPIFSSVCGQLFGEWIYSYERQGGHGTGKTGNLVLTFSRQGKHREFCCDTGKVFETQGKYFWQYTLIQKACFSSHIFKKILPRFARHCFLFQKIVFCTISTSIFTALLSLCITFVTRIN